MPTATDHDTWFHDLYLERAGELARYLRRHGADHDDADDLVSAVLLDAWRRREELIAREPACQRAWLYETAINQLRNHWRSRERRRRFLVRCPVAQNAPDVADAVVDTAAEGDRHRRLDRAVSRLSHADQNVLSASLMETSTTLSQRLGVTEATARQRLSRARRRLAAALALAVAVAVASIYGIAPELVVPCLVALAT